jgi:hypothetical protein
MVTQTTDATTQPPRNQFGVATAAALIVGAITLAIFGAWWYREARPGPKVREPALADKPRGGAPPAPAAATASRRDADTSAVTEFEWATFPAHAAEVALTPYRPVPLDTWKGLPAAFRTTPLVVYAQHELSGQGVVMPPAQFKVTRGGIVLVACDYSYQGNNTGGWTATRMTKEQFVEQGWRVLEEEKSGGPLWKSDPKKPFVVFWKNVREGETYSLRCNKYAPPFVILPAKAG